jgi:prolyl-tRNA synthetase
MYASRQICVKDTLEFNDWELKGIPLRIEFGPKDSARHVVTTPRPDINNKDEGGGETPISGLKDAIPALIDTIQANMFKKTDDTYRAHRV